jgi:protein ImuB
LIQERPEWRRHPAAVVAADQPQAVVLWVNEKAARAGVRPGHRYAAALALAGDLRAGVVSSARIERGVARIGERLHLHSPHVEPAEADPGAFWLDASGLSRIYPSLESWAQSIRADLARAGFSSRVVVGFSRFATYALAKSQEHARARVLATAEEEQAAARGVPLAWLGLVPSVRDALEQLGVRTVGDLLALPAEQLQERWGRPLHLLHRLAAGETSDPLHPRKVEAPLERSILLDAPDASAERLLLYAGRLLDAVLVELARRCQALAALSLRLRLDRMGERVETIRPAAPTLDARQILGLIRLRLETVSLPAGVEEILLAATGAGATAEQLRIFARQTRRDAGAAARAFARLRARFGEGTVVRAALRQGHLPEACFEWQPLNALPSESAASRPQPLQSQSPASGPRAPASGPRALVRRIYEKPLALPPRPRSEPDGWLLRGLVHGRVSRLVGPYVYAGAWWRRLVQRDYYYAQMDRGELLWIYYDRVRRRWFLHGRVE